MFTINKILVQNENNLFLLIYKYVKYYIEYYDIQYWAERTLSQSQTFMHTV